ncbi:MAG: branched-chain amino acid ABC transporter permease [Chloroflexi bacterium]|nr:branched-chain amino acid ABC transporter permease [Chloroflexota bacterium]
MNTSLLASGIVNGLLLGGVYVLLATGLTLVGGVIKIFNFGHGALLMLGAYISYWVFTLWGVDPYVSILVSGPLMFGVGYAIQRYAINPVLNAPEHNLLLITLGIGLFLENAALFLWSPDYRTVRPAYSGATFLLGDLVITLPRLYASLFALLITLLLYALIRFTDLGKAMRAAGQDREGAMLQGINIRRVYAITFGLGAACAGVGGSLISPFSVLSPGMGELYLLTLFVVIILGGLGSFLGVLVGGLLVGIAESMGALYLSSATKQVMPFVLFILILLFRPSGLFGARRD